MSSAKFTRYAGTLIFLWGVSAMAGFFVSGMHGNDALRAIFMRALVWWVYVCVACGGYMALVGIYHTLLAVFGLDGEPGLFSGAPRTGPLSGPTQPEPPADTH